ncbi:CsgG/HfaB family protein [Vulcaniibacterium tengchongense]|uniref:Curli biogenesis system outer membrane secretion channel CsgG n=1 Tax=Vulcaniibacterium tengchongense TaxID=1273429 RepID=A0A3N4VKF7_9GAMM|nr:CsgG/HfaB family protein [Vulcaniibacterium tengchongense]RPE79751.1 curli biogenesis system outer membrane secretion channel CsgG [Vulcaniibacterium tengchongense]
MNHSVFSAAAACVLGGAMVFASGPVQAQRKSAQELRAEKVAQIPVCARKLGTISVVEPEDATDWWTGQQLPAPSKLIKVFVNKSRCFTLLDRGVGMEAAMRERELAYGGELRGRSNVGKGQIKAADYVMVPDLIARNNDAGGNGVGALIGGLLGGSRGAALGGALSFRKKTADVVLTVTDVRSSEQVAMAEGNATKTDIGFGAGVGLFGGSGLGGAGLGGYANTEIGQVITMAYLQAYTDIVAQLGGLPEDASAANAQQAVTVIKPARLFTTPAGAKVVRSLDVGMMLYPTGNKQDLMWEVEDELGNKGWVSSSLLELSKRDPRDEHPAAQ